MNVFSLLLLIQFQPVCYFTTKDCRHAIYAECYVAVSFACVASLLYWIFLSLMDPELCMERVTATYHSTRIACLCY